MKAKLKSKVDYTLKLSLTEREAQILCAAVMVIDWESQTDEIESLLSELYDATSQLAGEDIKIAQIWYME